MHAFHGLSTLSHPLPVLAFVFVTLYDSNYTKRGTHEAAIRAQTAGAIGLMGEWTSANTIPTAYSSSSFGVPLCGAATTSDDLSNKIDFPLFMRAVPPDSGQGTFMADLSQNFNWTNVNVIQMDDAYGRSLYGGFLRRAALIDVKVAFFASLQPSLDDASYTKTILDMYRSSSRVTLFFGNGRNYLAMMRAAWKAGYGTDWVFITGDSAISTISLFPSWNITGGELAFHQGALVVAPSDIVPGFPRYETMAARFDGSGTVPQWQAKFVVFAPEITSVGVLVILILSGVVIAAVGISWVVMYINRKHRRVNQIGMPFITVLCLGIVGSLATPFLMVGVPTAATCAAQYWTLILGFSFSLSSIWIRSFRLYRLFDNRVLAKSQSVGTKSLIRRMIILPTVQVILLVILQYVGPLLPVPKMTGNTVQYSCQDLQAGRVGEGLFYAAASLNGALLILLGWISLKIRKVHTSFSDSAYIAYAMHNLLLAAAICFGLAAVFDGNSITLFYVKSCGVLYANIAIFVAMVARHIIHLHGETTLASHPSAMASAPGVTGRDGSGIDETDDEFGLGSGTRQSGSCSQLQRSILGGVYAVKSEGFLSRWIKYDIALLNQEGVVTFFDSEGKRPGQAFKLKHMAIDSDPVDAPMCVCLTYPSVGSFLVQYNSTTERDTWAKSLSLAGAPMSEKDGSMVSGMTGKRLLSGLVSGKARSKSFTTPQPNGGHRASILSTVSVGSGIREVAEHSKPDA
ncbi:hypothetical protein BCR44DRAFT_1512183 [Catenaria anguillulae PL171]|uniref:G-protein coupled receptors family 3 profile domain-containing protein n=1 Tax=Catenaria anguillulae PL171 TaxID=765915 RepID=A0A1Y2HS12_9FUNG|nr:hypothetical protein BCR44DRAFT_1512183 [Catenaria anguillulae PL171]